MNFSLFTLSVVLFALITCCAFFSGAEIGIMSINRYRLRHLVKQKNAVANRVNNMLQQPDKLLGSILIGNTFATIFSSMVATLIGQRLYGDLGVASATFLLSIVILIFAEMIPKTIAALDPQRIAFLVSRPLRIFQLIMSPIVQLLSHLTKGILRLFGIQIGKSQRDALSNEELRSVVSEAGSLIPSEHKTMLIGLLDLNQATVEDIMIPKTDIVGIDVEQPWHMILDQLTTAQHTRLPLYRGVIDQIIGIIHVRTLLNLVIEERLTAESLLKNVETPYFIPEATTLNAQISHFQKSKKRSGFVVDEYGDLQGLVTLEDILEEVVGEFTTDIAALSKDIVIENDGNFIIDGSVTLRHLQRVLGWQLPMIGPRTLSGLIIETLGVIPQSECCLWLANFQIEVMKISDNMIRTVRMRQVS